MKRICFLLFFVFLIISMLAQAAWTVQTVSNTRLKVHKSKAVYDLKKNKVDESDLE